MTEGKTGARLKVLALLCTFMFAALGTRLWFVQVLAQADYGKQAHLNSTRTLTLPAPRGRILDRNGHVLVRNRPSLVVTVNRQELPSDAGAVEREVARLAAVLHLPIATLKERIDTKRYYSFTPVPVAFDVAKKTFFYLGEHRLEFPGVAVEEDTVRDYLQGSLAAHLLGYVGPLSPSQANDPRFAPPRYAPDDIVGKSGVELAYEQYLQGQKGRIDYLVNSAGRNLGPKDAQRAVAGDDVVLTLDEGIQRLAQDSLNRGMTAARSFGMKADAGAVLVLDPNTGGILAMASNPTFDPNLFATGISQRQYNRLTSDKTHNPLFDRALQAQYPPGSTFKPFVALSSLHNGITNMRSSINCPAEYTVPGANEPPKANWEPVNHGYISLAQALVISCDTVFYELGWRNWKDYYHHNRDLLQNDLRALGFGRPTGVDVPQEASGLIPDAAWKHDYYHPTKEDPYANNWQPGDVINMSIGQGDVKVTPLQLATAYCALANGGTVYRPHAVEQVRSPDGKTVLTVNPHANGHLPFSTKQMDYVRQALRGVVGPGGTAGVAFQTFPTSRIPVAGKTGTAEVKPFQPYSWFAAMAPANDPKYVVVSIVEQGGHGSQSAAPIVRRVLDGLFGLPLTDPVTGTRQVD